MNSAHVLFNYFAKSLKYKNPTYLGKCLEVVAFPFKRTKVMLHCTAATMENLFEPPKNVRGMKVLDRNAFKKTIIVSCLIVPQHLLNCVLPSVKKYLLKVIAIKPVQEIEENKERILIDPSKANNWSDFDESTKQKLKSVNISEGNFSKTSIDMEYKNWGKNDLLEAILPEDQHCLKSYSVIGHIIHLNIKDHLLDYKNIIGEILLDKIPFAKTVVYKKHFIDNIYRNFEMEVICGEPNFLVTTKANNCVFEFDFSKVFWNPRLNSEHLRIVNILTSNDVLFDVFAGVGPFTIPAAKKHCLVFANDLNPESIKWLKHNITINKKAKDYITTYNKDGKDFILTDFKENFLKILQNDLFNGKIYVVMNLPEIAPTFIKYFKRLINKIDLIKVDVEKLKNCLPLIYCYFFVQHNECEKTVFEQASDISLDNIEYKFHFVRNVSGTSSMVRVEFILPLDYLVADKANEEVGEPLTKRICIE